MTHWIPPTRNWLTDNEAYISQEELIALHDTNISHYGLPGMSDPGRAETRFDLPRIVYLHYTGWHQPHYPDAVHFLLPFLGVLYVF
ncbi:hypothetical protein CQJ27_24820 [Escherichia sp. E1130]|nr:hypothetical protein CQJ27_24820 [Escherichia sp. E1130]TLI73302.1 hypothetical protein FEK66_07975 [Escherichia sp. E1130]